MGASASQRWQSTVAWQFSLILVTLRTPSQQGFLPLYLKLSGGYLYVWMPDSSPVLLLAQFLVPVSVPILYIPHSEIKLTCFTESTLQKAVFVHAHKPCTKLSVASSTPLPLQTEVHIPFAMLQQIQ